MEAAKTVAGTRETVIRVDAVSKAFGAQRLFNGLSLEVFRGETLVIMGGSGSGKSTLLRLMIGQVLPNAGHVYGLGKDLTVMTTRELAEYRKRIGVLFQSGAL